MIRSQKFVHTVGKRDVEWGQGKIGKVGQLRACGKFAQVQSLGKKGKGRQQVVIKSKQVEKYEDIEIEAITAQKQLSFFVRNKHENHINIFKIDEGQMDDYYLLERLKFNFESIIDKLSSIRIPYLRDLSGLGRGVMVNNYRGRELIGNHIQMRENTFIDMEISYENLMGLASGRISAQGIQEFMKSRFVVLQNFDDDKSEVEEQQQIIYNKNMVQVQDNHDEDLQQTEVELYKKMKYSKQQQQAYDMYFGKSGCIERQLDFKSYLFENMILQQGVHRKLERLMEKQYRGYFKDDKGYQDEDYVRLINMNKYRKDRRELIKIKNLKRMLESKNMNDEINRDCFIKQEIMKLMG